ncbi:MAG: hypothetical protein SGPRY_002198 [Prymnesium sp.]
MGRCGCALLASVPLGSPALAAALLESSLLTECTKAISRAISRLEGENGEMAERKGGERDEDEEGVGCSVGAGAHDGDGSGGDWGEEGEEGEEEGALLLQGARALLHVARGGEESMAALLRLGGVGLAARMLSLPPPTRDLAGEVVREAAEMGREGQIALLPEGGEALLRAVGSGVESGSWKGRCLLLLLSLLKGGDVEIMKRLLAAGLVEAVLSLSRKVLSERSVQLITVQLLGEITWRSPSSSLRASLRPKLKALAASHPPCRALPNST